jgi:DNA mismatch repair protein MutL
MPKIHQLSQHVISKIAAGEVIERPVYAVKELIENSLDAGADSIKVVIDESGLKRITVIDNGEGMSLEDIQECFKPHTTSKLTSEEQLHQIYTLGFRGEALSSIAAISNVTINSKTNTAVSGNSVILHDGIVKKIAPIGMPVGTTITVENLFHSVPARKKFLKSQRTEFRHIIDVLTHFAFSHPQVQFILIHNDKTIFDLPKTDDVINRIQTLLGNDVFINFMPIAFIDSYASVTGYIAKPQITTKTPHKQFLFINGRKVQDKDISQTLKHAYGTLLEKQTYPVCILFFSLPHEVVDVNVHPRKDEVRIMNAHDLMQVITSSVQKTLAKHSLDFNVHSWKSAVLLGDNDGGFTGKSTQSYAGKLLKEQHLPWTLLQSGTTDVSQVMQMHKLYLIAPTANGMAIFDQHAVHERILYEQFLQSFVEKKTEEDVHVFAKPKIFEFGLAESELLIEHMETFVSLGFTIEPFKGKSFVLRSVPQILYDRDYKVLISDILENLRMNRTDLDAYTKKMIAYLACRGAVKAGDSLTKMQCKDLLEQLEKTQNNATCPHGRPTKVVIDIEMMQTLFKR